jgi:Ca-activated chloride channel family protein
VVALARPRQGLEETKVSTEGIDIVLAVDVSGSMLAEDFKIGGERRNRLEVVKKVIGNFILGRESDRIGMVVFAGRAYTQCPLTLDYNVLLQLLDKARIGMVEDGTSIGSAIATCLNRLRNTKAESKVIILLTDGVNNLGKIDPQTAAEMARTLGVKIYTIGAGSKGEVPYPVTDIWGRTVYQPVSIPIDDESLEKIAQTTGGRYFAAEDTGSLEKIFKLIDGMEKTASESTIYTEYRELFPYFAIPAFCCLLIGIVLENTRFRRLP